MTSLRPAARERAGNIRRIAHGKDRFERGPVADNAIFKNANGTRRVSFFRHGKSQQRQAHADKHLVAVADLARSRGNHQFTKRVVHEK